MIYLDLAFRGGAVTLMLLLALLFWRAPISWEGRLSVLALALSESAFLITSAAPPIELHPAVHANLLLLSSCTPTAVTWLIVSIFLDAPGRRWPWIVASLITSVAFYIHVAFPAGFPLCLPLGVSLYGGLIVLSLWSSRDDLVECRYRARPGFALAIAGLALLLTISDGSALFRDNIILLALLQSSGSLIVAMAFAVWLLFPDATRWPGQPSREAQMSATITTTDTFTDPALIARIQSAMSDKIWQEEGLTIGALAGQLAVPEHRLRRAINQGLGHRNFSSFINHARIDAARTALANPARLNVTVLEIAFEVGFSSVGPFNRAFRVETGQSPTEYRRLALSNIPADSEKSSSFSVNIH